MSETLTLYYNKLADSYDKGYSSPICLAENDRVIQIISPYIKSNLLDIGCGTGFLLDYFFLEGYLGIDISTKMIELAKQKHPNAMFTVANMEDFITKCNPNTYDTIVSLYGPISYATSPIEFVRNCARILRPGGAFIFMPYTKRVERNLALGEYTTTSNSDVVKICYSQKMLEDLLKDLPFENTEYIGINYLCNFLEILLASHGQTISDEFCKNFLINETNLLPQLPIEYARHGLVITKKRSN